MHEGMRSWVSGRTLARLQFVVIALIASWKTMIDPSTTVYRNWKLIVESRYARYLEFFSLLAK